MDPVRWVLWISLLLEAHSNRYRLALVRSSLDRIVECHYLTLTRSETFRLVTEID